MLQVKISASFAIAISLALSQSSVLAVINAASSNCG
jgi:hypothetical protein